MAGGSTAGLVVFLDQLLAGVGAVGVDPEAGDAECPSQRSPIDTGDRDRIQLVYAQNLEQAT
jgi:hypothetical protein